MPYADHQVFLVMAQHSQEPKGTIAIVIADNIDRAREVFKQTYPDFEPVSWPSLEDMKSTVSYLEAAREERKLPAPYDTEMPVVKDPQLEKIKLN